MRQQTNHTFANESYIKRKALNVAVLFANVSSARAVHLGMYYKNVLFAKILDAEVLSIEALDEEASGERIFQRSWSSRQHNDASFEPCR